MPQNSASISLMMQNPSHLHGLSEDDMIMFKHTIHRNVSKENKKKNLKKNLGLNMYVKLNPPRW